MGAVSNKSPGNRQVLKIVTALLYIVCDQYKWMLLYLLLGHQGWAYSCSVNDNLLWSSDTVPSFPQATACLFRQGIASTSYTNDLDSQNKHLDCAHAAVSEPDVGQSLGRGVLKFFLFSSSFATA